jgi:hypothetical protein
MYLLVIQYNKKLKKKYYPMLMLFPSARPSSNR